MITVSYNSLSELKVTNENLRLLLPEDFEAILVDGRSTDGTEAFLGSERCSFQKVIREPDSGIYDAMNKGIALAQGEYIIFMNCGDRFFEGIDWNTIRTRLTEKKHIWIGNLLLDSGGRADVRDSSFKVNTFLDAALPHQASFIPKAFFETYGSYDLSFQIAADQEWFLRAMKAGAQFSALHFPVARYKGGGVSEEPLNRRRLEAERRRMLLSYLGSSWYFWHRFLNVTGSRRLSERLARKVRRWIKSAQ